MSRQQTSSGHDNNYHRPSRSEASLPPLHEVLGDLLVQPPSSPPPQRRPSQREGGVIRDEPSRYSRGPSLPPVSNSPAYYQSYSPRSPRSPVVGLSRPHQPPHQPSYPNAGGQSSRPYYQEQSQYSYDLFNVTPGAGLVHRRSSAQDDLDESKRSRNAAASSDSVRKYACPECGKRFAKPSTLKNHSLTHSGEKPFECEQPGCGKRFSMASNMQRHMKTHNSGSAFEVVPLPDDDNGLSGSPRGR